MKIEEIEVIIEQLDNMQFQSLEPETREDLRFICNCVSDLAEMVKKQARATARAANTASCLANGIQPD